MKVTDSGTDAVLLTREQFKTQTFLPIVDRLLQEMKRKNKKLSNFFRYLLSRATLSL